MKLKDMIINAMEKKGYTDVEFSSDTDADNHYLMIMNFMYKDVKWRSVLLWGTDDDETGLTLLNLGPGEKLKLEAWVDPEEIEKLVEKWKEGEDETEIGELENAELKINITL